MLSLCKDTTLEMKGKNRQIVQQCLERLTSSHIRRDILNSVYSRLNGLEASYLSEEEYIPEEPDWLIAGRIKWLKRTGMISKSQMF